MNFTIPWSAQLLIMILHELQPKQLYQRKRWKGLHDKEFSILAPPHKVAGGLPMEQNNNKSKTEYRASTWNVLCAFLPPYSLDCFFKSGVVASSYTRSSIISSRLSCSSSGTCLRIGISQRELWDKAWCSTLGCHTCLLIDQNSRLSYCSDLHHAFISSATSNKGLVKQFNQNERSFDFRVETRTWFASAVHPWWFPYAAYFDLALHFGFYRRH